MGIPPWDEGQLYEGLHRQYVVICELVSGKILFKVIVRTSSLSSLQHAVCKGVRPSSSFPKAKSLKFGSAPASSKRFVMETASEGKATAICSGVIPSFCKS